MSDRHTHQAVSIHYRGKPDSAYMECWCGKTEFAAVWWSKPPRGWSRRQWPKLRIAVEAMLESIQPRA